jgi:biotin transport system substrate-specific component
MSTLTLAYGRPTLADRIFSRRLVMDVVLIAAGAGLTSILAQVAIPLWPVPLTMQTFAVLFVGAALGPIRGALSMLVYLVIGVVGLPVFADHASGSILGSPTGGYVVGFIFAAGLVGWLAQRQWDRRWLPTVVAFLGGSLVVYVFGVTWLYVVLNNAGTPNALGAALAGGLYPFLIGDAVKAGLAGALLPLAWKALGPVKPKD